VRGWGGLGGLLGFEPLPASLRIPAACARFNKHNILLAIGMTLVGPRLQFQSARKSGQGCFVEAPLSRLVVWELGNEGMTGLPARSDAKPDRQAVTEGVHDTGAVRAREPEVKRRGMGDH